MENKEIVKILSETADLPVTVSSAAVAGEMGVAPPVEKIFKSTI